MRRILPILLLAAAWTSPAIASVYTFPKLTIYTGPGGQAVTINATIATLTLKGGGAFTVEQEFVTLALPQFTGLAAYMDWGCGEPCTISAPSQIDVVGFSGLLQFYGGDMMLNGTDLPWPGGGPDVAMMVSGPLAFTVRFYNDNYNGFILSVVPEPATWSLFGIGLLGLGVMTRRLGRSGGRDRD